MESVQILLVSISVFVWLVVRWRSSSESKRRVLPPGPSGVPILGNLLQLGPRPHEKMTEMAKVYGPLMALRLGFVTTIVASSPEMAREIMQRNDKAFSNRPVPDSVASQPNPEGTLAWVPGDHRWRNRRRICSTQMFTAQRLDYLQHFRHRKVHQLVEHVRKHSAAGTAVDIGSLAFAATLNLISNTIFSVDIIDPVGFETAQEFKDLVWRIMEDAGKLNLSDYFPALRRFDLQGVRRHVRVSYLRLHQIFDEIIAKRLQSRASSSDSTSSTHGDFLDVLLDQCQQHQDGFTFETIKPLILVLGRRRQVEESDIERLPYLQAIVKETLRLHPAAPLLLPYVAENDVQIDGYTIQKGNRVLVNAWCIGRDPKYWDDPLSFSPERFLAAAAGGGCSSTTASATTREYNGRDFEYIPFGAGRRICPGLPLANRMVTLILASLIHSFHWQLPPGITPQNLDMSEQFGITLKKAVPLYAIPASLPA
ncbi:hypothetical protein FEM48_Zijuj12G0012000 [Ziziphus jujuba var. spinosa]|uniref:Geraniol 8-hydroxylase-like n=1 Tax=Ziziphus jujuba var. spinosa TaxID=714518 RepID=A0A978UAC1_ZIZJJ|nr:hypothetical protein FEM48_Zijuj12G0012000 [Ziziphus jujuba var. spinosa]